MINKFLHRLRGATLAASVLLGVPLSAQTPSFRVTLLGTTGPSMAIDRPESGTLLQVGGEVLLFDCGRGIPERLNQLGMGAVNKVFLTHLHSDHTQGLPILWMGNWNSRGQNPLSIWGPAADDDTPAGTSTFASLLSGAFATNTHIRRDLVEKWNPEGILLDAQDVSEGVVYENNGVTVTAFLVDHAPVKPAYGYRVDYNGRSFVISGDTRPSDNLVKFSKGVDVLVHEVYLGIVGIASVVAAYHTLPEQAADVFNRAAPRLAVFSHIASTTGDPAVRTRAAGYSGPLQVGSDFMTIDIADKITVHPCTSPMTPVIASVTNADNGADLTAAGSIVVKGTGFSAEGGNSLGFARTGQTPIVLDATTGLEFSDRSATQITAALGGSVAASQWMLTVRNACSLTSVATQINLR